MKVIKTESLKWINKIWIIFFYFFHIVGFFGIFLHTHTHTHTHTHISIYIYIYISVVTPRNQCYSGWYLLRIHYLKYEKTESERRERTYTLWIKIWIDWWLRSKTALRKGCPTKKTKMLPVLNLQSITNGKRSHYFITYSSEWYYLSVYHGSNTFVQKSI